MKVTFNGTPQQVRQEMEQWLSNNQVDTNINDRVLLQLTVILTPYLQVSLNKYVN